MIPSQIKLFVESGPVVTVADYVSEFILKMYIQPAIERRQKLVRIDIDQLYEDLNGAYSRDFLSAVVQSTRFCETCRVAPESGQNGAEGGRYTFHVDLQPTLPPAVLGPEALGETQAAPSGQKGTQEVENEKL